MLKIGNFNKNSLRTIMNELTTETKYIFNIYGESCINTDLCKDFDIDLSKYDAIYDENKDMWIDSETNDEFKFTDNIIKDFFEKVLEHTEQNLQFIKSYNVNDTFIYIQCKTTKPLTLRELFDTLIREKTIFCNICLEDDKDLAQCLQSNSTYMHGEVVDIIE